MEAKAIERRTHKEAKLVRIQHVKRRPDSLCENRYFPCSTSDPPDNLSLDERDLPQPEQSTQGTTSVVMLTLAPQSPQEKLERFFEHQRPTVSELKERNILKDSKLAPSLQSAEVTSKPILTQAELERKRLEDELSAKLSIRPKPDELVEQNILNRTSRFKVLM